MPVEEKSIKVGGRLRYFGDGWQISKWLAGRRYWRVPVMDGEFTCEETFGTLKGVAGGNLILMGTDAGETLAATEAAVRVMCEVRDVILPFPAGIARSGSKVGSKYKELRASTNTAFAPTLRGMVPTDLPPEVRCVYEIVIDGLTLEAVERATAFGVRAGAAAGKGIVAITAGNYGGKLGPFHIRLHDVLNRFNRSPPPRGELDPMSLTLTWRSATARFRWMARCSAPRRSSTVRPTRQAAAAWPWAIPAWSWASCFVCKEPAVMSG